MSRIELAGDYSLNYRYSISTDENYYSVIAINSVLSEDKFKKNHPIGSYVQGNGHNYEITDIRSQYGELFICLKTIL